MISVIIPVYNSKNWLEKSVSSVLGQSYRNLEILLVDDGSTDGSGVLCDKIAERDSRITVIHQQNAGAQVARWNALDIAKGEWVAFVDSDDWIDRDMYEGMLGLAGNDTDIVWCDLVLEFENRSQIQNMNIVDDCDYLMRGILAGDIGSWSCNKLIRRSLLTDSRVDMSDADMMMEDMLLSVQLIALNPKIVYTPQPYYHYNRINDGSITNDSNSLVKAGKNLELICAFLERAGLFDKYKNKLSHQLMRYKIAVASAHSIKKAKKVFPFAHKNLCSYPLVSWRVKVLYWLFFNAGLFGETCYSIYRRWKRKLSNI